MDVSRINDLVRSELAKEVPEFEALIGSAVVEVRGLVGRIYAGSPRPALALLMTQLVNDFEDLCFDMQHGRGRTALRTTRSLFDALLAVLDIVEAGSNAADRYEDHIAVAGLRAAEMRSGFSGLSGNELRSERHRRRKAAARHRIANDAAISKWGNGFGRSWTSLTTRDRATAHGLGGDYDLFRVASAAVHASAGGAFGLVSEVANADVYRVGPALQLCPLALGDGTRYVELGLGAIGQHLGVDTRRANDAISNLRSVRNAYTGAMRRLDRNLWPEHPPPGTVVLRALLPDGERRWILHDNQTGKIITCTAPCDGDPAIIANNEKRLDIAERDDPERSEWITYPFFDLTAEPIPGASWRSDGHIIPPSWLRSTELLLPYDQ